ncbi:DUF935 domain-containing protein [Oceanobacter sp. 4_MG-2023]|uniref:DUF935 domain-containing protein n=1 Tax=Oceanobacter sp. 4_MG-2023 TaxID=3062623 RepID=UPI0027346F43|nr:DUF935 domain-containing protein [Oceanobacter sp. 4_MG-2023]MDP2548495.1 DUF935 domain-containing protein [Oceanobacter sp. 4_MG-2023]
MADSLILDHNGQPFKKTELSKSVAAPSITGIRNIWNFGTQAEWLSPERLAQILRDAAEGDADAYLTLAEEIEERDPHYASVLGTRKRAVSGLPTMVEAATDDKKDQEITDAVRALIRRPEFHDMADDLLDALGKGFSVVEMNWDTKRQPWEPRTRNEKVDGEWQEVEGYEHRDPRFFQFDRVSGKQLRIKDEADMLDGLPLPPHKFIVHKPRLKTGLPIRGGLARLVAVSYMCKSYTVTDWLAFAEVFGMPLRVGRYNPNATPADINTLINAIANIGTDAAAAIPDTMRIDFESPGNVSGGADVFKNLAEWLDKQVSKAVLGQTASTEGTPGKLGNDDAQDDVRTDILKADARQLSNTINKHLVRSFVDLNFGPQEHYPRVEFQVIEPEDTEALTAALKELVPLGLKVEASVIRDKLGLPDPEPGAELLGAQQQTPAPTPTPALNQQHHGCHCAHCSSTATAINRQLPDPAEQALDELEQDGLANWQQQIDPVLQPIRDLLESVDTAEDFAAGLQDLLDEMDDSDLVSKLALQMFLANGAGDGADS